MGRPETPIDPEAGPVQRFAWQLRQLRESAGSPSYRALARKAHFSVSTLADAAKGDRLPSLEVTLGYVTGCGGDIEQWRARWTAAGQALATADAPDRFESRDRSPYPGLAPLATEHADRFFGRAALLDKLAGRVDQQPVVALFGASGSGKSSLLRAGLLGRLAADTANPRRWRTMLMTPGEHPLDGLSDQVAKLSGEDVGRVREALATDPAALDVALRGVLAGGPASTRALLVVDQFEELFTVCRDAAERSRFLALVLDAAIGSPAGTVAGSVVGSAGERRTTVVLGVRADVLGRLAEYPELVEALGDQAYLLVGPVSAADLTEIITQPAALVGLTVAPDLVATIVADADEQPGSLPLVSHALQETWRHRESTVLTVAAYQASGGVKGAIAQTAERVYSRFSLAEQLAARRIFLRLTALGDGTEDTRRPIARAELDGVAEPAVVAAVIDALADARLVVLGQPSAGGPSGSGGLRGSGGLGGAGGLGVPGGLGGSGGAAGLGAAGGGGTVEVAHEALIRAWPRLHRWLTDDRTTLVVHRRLTEATQTWEQLDRDDGALYRGAQLVAAQAWVQDHPGEPNRVEATFLAASTALAEAAAVHDRRRARLFQRLVAAVSVLLVLALVGGVFAVAQRQSARRQQVDSLAAELALRSRSLLPTDPDLAGLLAVEAARLHPDPETQGAVLSVAAAPARVQFNVDGPAITAVAFSPDHTRLAAATADGTVGLWAPAAGRRATVLSGLKGRATAVAYSADGTEVAAAGGGLIMAWDARTGALEHQVAEPNMRSAMALSADGGTVAASVGAGDIVLRDLSTGGRRVLHADPTWFTSLSFSADGRLLAAASGVADPLVWNVGPGTLRERLSAPHAYTVDFAPTGTVLAASADDRGVYLWDLGGPATVRLPDLPLQGGYGWSISPPTAGTLAVGDEAGGVTIWDIARRRRIEAFTDRGRSETASVTISPDGALMASAGFNGSIIVHDLHHTPFAGFDAGVTDVKVSPDGSVIATGGTDGAVRLWTPAGALVATLDGAPDQLAAVAFSPDGRLLAAVTRNMTIAIWDVHTHQPVLPTIRPDTLGASTDVVFNPAGTMLGVATLGPNLWDVHDPAHPVDLSSTMEVHLATTMAFTPDGRRLIGASVSGLIFTWDITTGKVVSRVDSHQGALQDLAQSPDGRLLATAGDSRTITLWDTATMKPIAELSGHTAPVQVLAFSRDGRTLASAGDDHAVLVWDVASRQLTATLTGHSARIRGLAFTPAGILVSGAEDGRIISWDLDPARSAARICARVGRNLTANEWAANLGSQAYDKTCP